VEFSTKGLAAATGAIVSAAGVTQPALYHHFGSKRDLFLAVVDDTYATVLRRFDEQVPPDAPFAESLDRLLDCSISVMRADPSLAAMISTVQFEIRRDPALADDLRPTLARFRTFFDDLARRAPPSMGVDPRALSRVLVTLIGGLNSQALLLPDAQDFPDLVEALRALLRSGMRPAPVRDAPRRFGLNPAPTPESPSPLSPPTVEEPDVHRHRHRSAP
jgi:AcrR family transcriptional regulator